jgi:hypothetical protein
MPEDVVFDQDDRHYPTPAQGLMINPFPKVKKHKKKKRKPRAKTV